MVQELPDPRSGGVCRDVEALDDGLAEERLLLPFRYQSPETSRRGYGGKKAADGLPKHQVSCYIPRDDWHLLQRDASKRGVGTSALVFACLQLHLQHLRSGKEAA